MISLNTKISPIVRAEFRQRLLAVAVFGVAVPDFAPFWVPYFDLRRMLVPVKNAEARMRCIQRWSWRKMGD